MKCFLLGQFRVRQIHFQRLHSRTRDPELSGFRDAHLDQDHFRVFPTGYEFPFLVNNHKTTVRITAGFQTEFADLKVKLSRH